MELTEQDILNNDYDWFVVINHTPIHVASDGTLLPNYIAAHFEEQLEARKKIMKLPEIEEILDVNPALPRLTGIYNHAEEYNDVLLSYFDYKLATFAEGLESVEFYERNYNFGEEFEGINNINVLRHYLNFIYVPEFAKFGHRGFLSFDHTISKNSKDSFHWVVNPNFPLSEDIHLLHLPSFFLNDEDPFENLFSESVDLISLVNKYLSS